MAKGGSEPPMMESDARMLGLEIKTKDEVSATTTKEGFDFQAFHVNSS